jgi:hypothetical protein
MSFQQCQILKFTNITPAVWDCLKNKVNDQRKKRNLPPITLADSGQLDLKQFGLNVIVKWKRDPIKQTLEINCQEDELLLNCNMIESAIRSEVHNCGGQ